MIKKISLILAIIALSVVANASAHTGQVQVTCSGFTFAYQNFPEDTTVAYTASTKEGSISGSFEVSGSGTIEVLVNLSGNASIYLHWDAEEGGRAYGKGQLGCNQITVPPPSPPIYDYCGTGGPVVFAELLFKQPDWDPVWKDYTPAVYVQGLGSMCPWDVPAGYVKTGKKVDPVGQNYGGNEEGAIYDEYVKA